MRHSVPRTMRHLLLPALALAAAASLAPATAGARSPAPGCYPRGSETFGATARVRVYGRTNARSGATAVYVCDLLSGRRTRTGLSSGRGEAVAAHDVTFAGRVAAFLQQTCTGDDCSDAYLAVDAATGARTDAGDPAPLNWVVFPSRLLVWVQRDNEQEVGVVAGSDGNELDRGAGVDPQSLATSRDGRAYWLNEGEPRSAQVAGPANDPAVANPRGNRRCYPRGARTAAASARVRVYRTVTPSNSSDIYTYTACDLRGGRRVVLARTVPPRGPEAVRIVGYRVAMASGFCGLHLCAYGGVVRADVRSGRLRTLQEASNRHEVTDLLLTPSGSVAWIQRLLNEGGTTTGRTAAACDGDECRELESDEAIAERSLGHSHGGSLYWTVGDSARATPLP